MYFDSTVCQAHDIECDQKQPDCCCQPQTGSLARKLSQLWIDKDGYGQPVQSTTWTDVDQLKFNSIGKTDGTDFSSFTPGRRYCDQTNLTKTHHLSASPEKPPRDTKPSDEPNQMHGACREDIIHPEVTTEYDSAHSDSSNELKHQDEDANWYVKRFIEYLPTGDDNVPYDEHSEECNIPRKSKSVYDRYTEYFSPKIRKFKGRCLVRVVSLAHSPPNTHTLHSTSRSKADGATRPTPNTLISSKLLKLPPLSSSPQTNHYQPEYGVHTSYAEFRNPIVPNESEAEITSYHYDDNIRSTTSSSFSSLPRIFSPKAIKKDNRCESFSSTLVSSNVKNSLGVSLKGGQQHDFRLNATLRERCSTYPIEGNSGFPGDIPSSIEGKSTTSTFGKGTKHVTWSCSLPRRFGNSGSNHPSDFTTRIKRSKMDALGKRHFRRQKNTTDQSQDISNTSTGNQRSQPQAKRQGPFSFSGFLKL